MGKIELKVEDDNINLDDNVFNHPSLGYPATKSDIVDIKNLIVDIQQSIAKKSLKNNSHGLTWSINPQAQPITNNKSNSKTDLDFHINSYTSDYVLTKKPKKMGGNQKLRASISVGSSFITGALFVSGIFVILNDFFNGLLILFLAIPGFGTTISSLFALFEGELYDHTK